MGDSPRQYTVIGLLKVPACRRHLDFFWIFLMFSPPAPMISFTLLDGTSISSSGFSSSSTSSSHLASTLDFTSRPSSFAVRISSE
jgi:hypothetical protein